MFDLTPRKPKCCIPNSNKCCGSTNHQYNGSIRDKFIRYRKTGTYSLFTKEFKIVVNFYRCVCRKRIACIAYKDLHDKKHKFKIQKFSHKLNDVILPGISIDWLQQNIKYENMKP
jgi:hypothetical protein